MVEGEEIRCTLSDGRELAAFAVGASDGPLVLHNHGGPSCRWEVALLADAAASLGLRLVGVDRPGQGQSSPQRERTYAGWTADLEALADHLGADRFAVTGWSEGGPWALGAAAYGSPERFVHVTSIAGGSYGAFGANWAAEYQDTVDALGGRLALHFHPGFRLMYDLLEWSAVHGRTAFARSLRKAVGPEDATVLDRPGLEDAFLDCTAECFAHGADGLVRDATVLYEQWDFDVATITRPVHLWQGMSDRLVPPPINQRVCDEMPGGVWHPVDGIGHFVAVSGADQILGIVAEDLARG